MATISFAPAKVWLVDSGEKGIRGDRMVRLDGVELLAILGYVKLWKPLPVFTKFSPNIFKIR